MSLRRTFHSIQTGPFVYKLRDVSTLPSGRRLLSVESLLVRSIGTSSADLYPGRLVAKLPDLATVESSVTLVIGIHVVARTRGDAEVFVYFLMKLCHPCNMYCV